MLKNLTVSIVYGGTGKAARNWDCYEAIVNALRDLGNEETLLVQSGKPVAVFLTHKFAPRVLISTQCWCLIGQPGKISGNLRQRA